MNKLELERRLRRLEETVWVNKYSKIRETESSLPNDYCRIVVDVQTQYIQKLIQRDQLNSELLKEILSAARRAVRKLTALGFDVILRQSKWMNVLNKHSFIGDADCVSIMFRNEVSKNYKTAQFQTNNIPIAENILEEELQKVI